MNTLDWTRNVEQIVLSVMSDDNRIVGIAAIRPGAGASLLCHSLAKTLGDGGLRTLRVDFDPPARDPAVNAAASDLAPWEPGRTKSKPWIRTTSSGYDLLEVRTTDATRPLFANMALLRQALAEEFAEYRRVIIEIPPVASAALEAPNPISISGACDAMLLLVVVGRDLRPEVQHAVSSLRRAGVNVSAVVTTSFGQLTAREEASHMVDSIKSRLTMASISRQWNRLRNAKALFSRQSAQG
jgi:Mrp family chromosome partitioning ATPase